jgi:hypothetical protein
MAVVYILGQLSICGKKDIFTGKTKQLEWPDRKHLRVVNDFDSALEAIKAIVDQGEGASAYNPLQQNVDSSELAHYFKFSSMFHGRQITTFNVTNEKVFNNNEQVNKRSVAMHFTQYGRDDFDHYKVMKCEYCSSRILHWAILYTIVYFKNSFINYHRVRY